MLVPLPPALAERFGAPEADVKQDDDEYGLWHVVVAGVDVVRRLSLDELGILVDKVLPHERAPEPERGRPLKRGEKPREPRRPRGEPFSAHRTGRYAGMMSRGSR